MTYAIEAKRLNKSYRDFALKDVSFSLPQGQVMGFVGENGAGKTTTIKALLQVIHLDGGRGVPAGSAHAGHPAGYGAGHA